MSSACRALLLAALLASSSAAAQVFVIPRHAGKALVRHYDLEWKHVDLKPSANGGGMRLFFYERERRIAEYAAASVTESMTKLETQFSYAPELRFEYFLYSSYAEFLQSNLFPLQEGVLGVTSPLDLKLTLPYLGDHRLFKEVSTHELAHEFTIQKAGTLAAKEKVGSALERLPLWFIEGLAEYYAKDGMDAEAEALVRDLVINPDPEHGHYFTDFFADGPPTFLWIYKMGQARCAFLTQTYGADFIQRVLEASPRLVKSGDDRVDGFPALLEQLTGDRPEIIAKKFETWAKRGASRSYLEGTQELSTYQPVLDLPRDIDAMTANPSGEVLMFRTFDPYTGQTRLFLVDPRNPIAGKQIIADSVPGFESLHPMFGRNFDINHDTLIFVAEWQGRDVLYVQQYSHKTNAPPPEEKKPMPTVPGVPPHRVYWDVELGLGKRVAFDFEKEHIVAILSPSISPDGKSVAFIGLDEGGQRDVYLMNIDASGEAYSMKRLTNDTAGERQLSWGAAGIVFNSDDSEGRHFNLFKVDPANPDAGKVRLTGEARDELDPRALPDGRIVFCAWEHGRMELYELLDDVILRRTDVTTGLFEPSPGTDGSIHALMLYEGQKVPVRLTKELLAEQRDSLTAGTGEPAPEPARQELAEATRYRALNAGNWQLGPTFAMLGGGSGGIAGQVMSSATDRLRNHALLLSATFYGSFELLDGILLYLNQEHRVTWGFGPFQEIRFRDDPTFSDEEAPFDFVSGQRFYGGMTTVRYPLNTFARVEADLAVGGMTSFLMPFEQAVLSDPDFNGVGDLLPEWRARNAGAPLVVETSLRAAHDTIRYHAFSGPIAGHSLLLESIVGYQPLRGENYSNYRLDAAQYFPIIGRTRLALLGGAGATFGGKLAREFYLSSSDTIRGIPFADTQWLIGRHFAYTTAEMRLPLDALIQVAFLSRIEAVAGFDFGGIGDTVSTAWNHRILDFATGINFAFGPLLARVHIARPFDTGGSAGLPVKEGSWVPQFSLRIVGLEGFFGFGPRGADGATAEQWEAMSRTR